MRKWEARNMTVSLKEDQPSKYAGTLVCKQKVDISLILANLNIHPHKFSEGGWFDVSHCRRSLEQDHVCKWSSTCFKAQFCTLNIIFLASVPLHQIRHRQQRWQQCSQHRSTRASTSTKISVVTSMRSAG